MFAVKTIPCVYPTTNSYWKQCGQLKQQFKQTFLLDLFNPRAFMGRFALMVFKQMDTVLTSFHCFVLSTYLKIKHPYTLLYI